jgi:hypothetical protein
MYENDAGREKLARLVRNSFAVFGWETGTCGRRRSRAARQEREMQGNIP